MIDTFVYPVSAIMKFWHLIISQFMGDSPAWILSIVMLVLTVRGFIAPLNWMSIRSGRISALMRPRDVVFRQRLDSADNVDDMVAILREQRDLKESYGFNSAAGCLPVLIMIPFFLGLYQTVLRMARINDLSHVGFLNQLDIANFRAAKINGVSITDYAGKHVDLIAPILIAAICFTVLSTMITMYRGFLTTRFDEKAGRRLFFFTAFFIALVPYMLWNMAVHGPIPVAVIIYWGCTYLYTLLQTVAFEVLLRKKYPLTPEVHAYRREGTQIWLKTLTPHGRKAARQQKKETKRAKKDAKRERKRLRKTRKRRFRLRNIKLGRLRLGGGRRENTGAVAAAAATEKPLTHSQMLSKARSLIKAENKERKQRKAKGAKSS